jgi:hypothetical protein
MLAGDGSGNCNFISYCGDPLSTVSHAPCLFIVVNCIQSHPHDCAVATSGIDNTIKV